jgi:hypothetical protein
MATFPLPGTGSAAVAVPAPGTGPRCWAGAPSAVPDGDGFVVAYRVRVAADDVARLVIARAPAGGTPLETVAELDRRRFGVHSLERPALVRLDDGRWRLYVCCATPLWPKSRYWWIEVLDADTPEGFATASSRLTIAGDSASVAVKDPVIRYADGRWQAWICCHPLDEKDAEDRMTTAYATSADGLAWDWHGTALAPRPGTWDARGARVTAVLPDGRAAYDGRASAEENFSERTGLAEPEPGPDRPGGLRAVGDGPVSDARYLDVVPLPGGGYRLWYEAPLPDGSHELRTELVSS